jgi:hypothetical protein
MKHKNTQYGQNAGLMNAEVTGTYIYRRAL